MLHKVLLGTALLALSAPVYAGAPLPGPEAGAGLAAMALVGAAYAYLRRRRAR